MRAWMSLKFGQIRLLVYMATDRVIMEKTVLPLLICFYPFPSYLQVIMTCMRARRSSKFDQVRLLTAELAALENIPHRLTMGKWCCNFFSAIPDQILFIFEGNDDIHKSLDEFKIRPDPIRHHRVRCS